MKSRKRKAVEVGDRLGGGGRDDTIATAGLAVGTVLTMPIAHGEGNFYAEPDEVKRLEDELGRFHAHGLIAKIPHTRRWRVTLHGRHVMGTSLYLRDQHFPNAYRKIAA